MRKLITYTLFAAFILSCAAEKAAGKFEIVKGVNVSHWLSQSEKRGQERLEYITAEDFKKIADMGFDHVRIPVDEVQLWDSTGHKEEEAFKLLHNAIDWALANKLRVIVDLHIIRSHYFNANNNTLWTDPKEQDKLADLWKQLSAGLRVYPTSMLAYEILNEAVANNPEDWNNLIARMIREIRAEEPERVIVVGSNMWQNAYTFPTLRIPENDPHLILSYHFYTPFALTHHQAWWSPLSEYAGPVNYPGQIVDTLVYRQLSPAAVETMRGYANGFFDKARLEKEMMPAITYAREKKLPLYCGEFGVYPTIDNEIRLRYYQDVVDIFKTNGIAYCHWCYKGDFPILQENGDPDGPLVAILVAP